MTSPFIQPLRIADRTIGPGRAVFIVAEAGVNHDGCAETALRLVDLAAESGADAVKFQMFRAEELTTADAPAADYQRKRAGAQSQRDLLKELELSMTDFARVRTHCDRRGILFLATPFSLADVPRLVELRAAAIKIASTDLTNTPLLLAAAETGLPMIVSTGAATDEEIRAAVERFRAWNLIGRLALLHCVSSYPTPVAALNLRAISTLRDLAGVPVGLSDHSTSTQSGAWAAAAGACILEKHITLDRSAAGPDHALSLDARGFAEYVRAVRDVEAALGTGGLGMTDIERDVRRVARKSVVAARDIPAGAALTPDMLTIKRPGGGVEPADLGRLLGRRTTIAITRDTTIDWNMVTHVANSE